MMTHDRNSAATTSFRVPPAPGYTAPPTRAARPPADSVTAMALRVAARLAMRGDHSGAEQCRQLAASWAVSK
ncbi:Uncharacterised protein [Mycobacteroides abscessus subsp. abscessus]|uniref:hypothetical protein n=1 Tax=Mycobacteroides abscessus TaxID=36809 RepID=UPI0009282A4F|nr:hypothetical protein [Mycobacteroides abscessus]SHX66511.1 Uncharacterised protein [Mycobacteroides abscessus subsp. abscessus]SIC60092.1 Uncharacterised protein [Mycobacteroides abscessus subsp. abscessus]SKK20845.1 Uncharacterised protein [Mycobacteroides abscessus subsp. abscessus]SKP50353.1 Uncharacterised protein [Mycobacteroides abscessus subsp. abscessus]